MSPTAQVNWHLVTVAENIFREMINNHATCILFMSDTEHYSEWGSGNSRQRKLTIWGKENEISAYKG